MGRRTTRRGEVCPGWRIAGIQTDLISHFIPREDFEPQLVAYYSPPRPGKLWKPEDMATSIAYLASAEAHMINGAVLVCDGGTLA